MLYHDAPDEKSDSRFLPVYKFTKKDYFYTGKISLGLIIGILAIITVIAGIVFSFIRDDDELKSKELAQSLHENVVVAEEVVAEQEPVPEVTEQSVESTRRILAAHSIENIKTKFLPRQLENPQETIKNLYFQEQKHVYLTFDDGPTSNITPQILDILKEENVKATFFIIGFRAENLPDIVKRAYDEGHYIANHGYSHSYKTIYAGVETVWGEYARTEQIIRNCIQIQEYNSYLFRFPGGSAGGKYSKVKAEAKDYFESQKVATINWNALSGDAEGATTREEQLEYIERTSTDNTIILLMHDAADKQVTADTLREIIAFYRDRGYEFKNFYEIF